jgi:NAD-dependent deacetylase
VTNELEHILSSASRVVVFTGAGISAESGISTFRSPDGIWARFKPEELANINAFMANPERVWEWYEYRRGVVTEAKPNAGHRAIVELEKIFDRVDVITQNVDGLHQRAGSSRIHELHGSLLSHRCLDCGTPYELSDHEDGVPHCPVCGGLIRPGVVWFGEELPEDVWDRAVDATINCDLFLSIGTSTIVYPAASLPFMAAREGKFVVEVNPKRTDFTRHADLFLQGAAGMELPKFIEQIRKIKKV